MERQTQKVRDLKAQRALRTRRAVSAFVAEADLLREYNAVLADFRPGGAVGESAVEAKSAASGAPSIKPTFLPSEVSSGPR